MDHRGTKSQHLVHTEAFEDFAKNSFLVTINKVQQAALSKSGGKLPTPAEQLDLVNKRRVAKKGREGKANHSWLRRNISNQCFLVNISEPFTTIFHPFQVDLAKEIRPSLPSWRLAGRLGCGDSSSRKWKGPRASVQSVDLTDKSTILDKVSWINMFSHAYKDRFFANSNSIS